MEIKDIIRVMTRKGYSLFETDTRPFNLNYVGIRDITSVNTFNDWLVMFWKYKGQWSSFWRLGTTDPGTYFLNEKMGNSLGTALLKEGQYRGAWKLGLHRGKYKALVQRKEVTVIRDANKDGKLNMDGDEYTGYFGINHHHAGKDSTAVNNWSAGCQTDSNLALYNIAVQLWEASAEEWGEGLTYTLLNVTDFR